MPRLIVVVLLFALSTVVALAQVDPNKLPTVTTQGNTNPEAISDANAQLIWLLAATTTLTVESAPNRDEARNRIEATILYRLTAFPSVKPGASEQLTGILDRFRSAYTSLASEFNDRIASVARDDIWREYRDFRVKTNDLVTQTMHTLNDTFPDDVASLRSEIQRARDNVSVSTYRSSSDPDYTNNPRTAATGFAYIQGAVSASAYGGGSKEPSHWITAVMVGMVPGCPGMTFPTATIDGSYAEGPKQSPLQYIDFQRTFVTASSKPSYFLGVKCAIPVQK